MCSFLITGRDTFLSRAEMGRLACYMGDARGHVHLPAPAILKPMELWTGKQLFSLLLRPHADVKCVPPSLSGMIDKASALSHSLRPVYSTLMESCIE